MDSQAVPPDEKAIILRPQDAEVLILHPTGFTTTPVLRPTWLPAGFTFTGSHLIWPPRGSEEPRLALLFLRETDGRSIQLVQGSIPPPSPLPGGETLTLTAGEATWTVRKHPYPAHTLSWTQEGSHLELTATALSRQELVQVAESLAPLSEEGPQIKSMGQGEPAAIADAVDFVVFVPRTLPRGKPISYQKAGAHRFYRDGVLLDQRHYSAFGVEDRRDFRLYQYPTSSIRKPPAWAPFQEVQVGDAPGWWYCEENGEDRARIVLGWSREGTDLFVTFRGQAGLSREELLKWAASLQPVNRPGR